MKCNDSMCRLRYVVVLVLDSEQLCATSY